MTTPYICPICKSKHTHQEKCCGVWTRLPCEKAGCHDAGTKAVYALGYVATVCEHHYQEATEQDRQDAINFRYSEG
jgi:hypothetical protein